MALIDLTSTGAVMSAIQEFDLIGREPFLEKYGFHKARSYFLVHEGRAYDSKAIVGAAYGYQYPNTGPLNASEFSGGDATVRSKLEELGFSVVVDPADIAFDPQAGTSTMQTTIHDGINEVLNRYPKAHTKPFAEHALGGFVRNAFAECIRSVVDPKLLVKGSVGNGNWAETPWLAVFDPTITKSAQNGFYVVYLFDQEGRFVYLSLNQATTEVQNEFKSTYRDVLASRAEFARVLLGQFDINDLVQVPLNLTGTGALTRGYCSGNIVSIRYDRDAVPKQSILVRDLLRMISLYATYAAAKKGDIGESEEVPPEIPSGKEAQKYRWHRRAERNQKLSDDAKKYHGTSCMVCGFSYETKYGARGSGYIEAHHVIPFANLVKELEPVTLDPKTDFVVVCANCHRMLHRTNPPITADQLKDLLS